MFNITSTVFRVYSKIKRQVVTETGTIVTNVAFFTNCFKKTKHEINLSKNHLNITIFAKKSQEYFVE